MCVEKLRRLQCFNSNCDKAETFCEVFRGNQCINLGGHKIPVERKSKDCFTPIPTGAKPYFCDGRVVRDSRVEWE
jgi:hypothetical protein